LDTLLDGPWYVALLSLLDLVQRSTADFWRQNGLLQAPVPLTTGAISSPMGLGSDSSPLWADIAGKRIYLADSQQFALELLCRLSSHGCWYVMESFRGEPNDARHLGQFIHSEVEAPVGLDDIIQRGEAYVRRLATDVLDAKADTVAAIAGTTSHLERALRQASWPRLTFDAAAAELAGFSGAVHHDARGFRVLTGVGERELTRRYETPVWVTHFDEMAVPFYQACDETPLGRRARNADLLLGRHEALGAGERHQHVDDLLEALDRHGVDPEPYGWYVDLRERQPLRTSGFGLGVERFLMWALDHDDIRDLQLLLRSHGEDLRP
jgi:asparaginyl-tRNA synthetase